MSGVGGSVVFALLTCHQKPALLGFSAGFGNADGSISLEQITGGIPPYSFDWSTGDTTQSIDNLLPADYFLQVMDALGCTTNVTIVVGFEVSTDELQTNQQQISVYPNPVKSGASMEVWLSTKNSGKHHIQLLDITGSALWERSYEDLSNNTFAAPENKGIYVLLIENEMGERAFVRFVVE